MKRWKLQLIPESPVKARVAYQHWNFSPEDDLARPNEYLIDLSISVFNITRNIKLDEICQRFPKNGLSGLYPNLWPGDHYRLLAGFVKYLKPLIIVEIGTSFGTSALALFKYLPKEGMIYTYDLVSVSQTAYPLIEESEFEELHIKQIIGNLADYEFYKTQESIIKNADIIFIDAVKDVVTEQKFLEHFKTTEFTKDVIMIWDDIKAIPEVWRSIDYPKIDITSFGHFTGTGLVHWKKDK